ncbi:hypothetical protein FPOAC1_008192 [Fusarium poae]|uniref:Uncharacterized protein n=1 Tax=Fusarium poae TaxID=36050 RepID=A0A1B8AKM6_FUSPO|nr:hypothetical protein FPOAC1_008192 [Fusarium poae]KAG8668808.1 hypothetical protein FPOAC1_008192 [Fusarium poae]OBS21038.1 hypothetical protein FPOA_07378 [Fusarium poae]
MPQPFLQPHHGDDHPHFAESGPSLAGLRTLSARVRVMNKTITIRLGHQTNMTSCSPLDHIRERDTQQSDPRGETESTTLPIETSYESQFGTGDLLGSANKGI